MKRKIFQAALLLLSLLATIKICFFGLGVDEEYAVTMAYRLAAGDRMFLDMWEPHQTSGFLAAGLIRLFLASTGSADYLVLFLRGAGALIQALISVFLYRTLKNHFSKDASLVAAVFFYNTLPKWIQMPDFSNMLVWFSVLTMLCFLRYYLAEKRSRAWLVAASLSMCVMVLSYPSCILAVPVVLFCMRMADRRRFKAEAGITILTCAGVGAVYVVYFLTHMSLSQFLFGLKQMMTDGAHSAGALERLQTYGWELVTLLPYAGITLGISGLLVLLFRRLRSLPAFCLTAVCIAQIGQVIVWLGNSRYIHFPLVYFYILYGAGVILYLRMPRSSSQVSPAASRQAFTAPQSPCPQDCGQPRQNDDAACDSSCRLRSLFWMGSAAGAAVWLSALVITNTTISVTGSYLMPGLISAILFLSEACTVSLKKAADTSPEKTMHPAPSCPRAGSSAKVSAGLLSGLSFLTALCLLGTTLFAKGYLMCENEGVKNNITYVRQKALSGPAKGIYYRYMEGYGYNSFAQLVPQYIREDDRVLYVGQNTLYYVLCGQTISTYSTISTPTFDERLTEYWERYPQRYPTVVIVDTGYTGEAQLDKLLKLGEPVAESDGIVIYLTE